MKKIGRVFFVAAMTIALARAPHADIDIATAGPMSGPYASFGDQMKRAAEATIRSTPPRAATSSAGPSGRLSEGLLRRRSQLDENRWQATRLSARPAKC